MEEAAPTPAAATPFTPVAPHEPGEGSVIGWGRAIASGLAILLVGFGGGLLGSNLVLTKALGLTREARQYLATALFIVVVIVLAWALRWLQARGLI